jgi:hypothetical protein
MRMNAHLSAVMTAILGVAAGGLASAATLDLTDTVTATGTGAGQTYTVTPSGLPGNAIISPTTTFNLGNTLNLSSSNTNFNLDPPYSLGANGSGGPWNFQDDYAFSTTGATVQSALITLTSTLSDLQARLIYAAGNTATSADPILGPPPGGTVVDSWQTLTLGGTSITDTLATPFAPGSYILQVRGEATPGGSSSYGGAISFTAVPVPAALPLLLSGVAALGVLGRRRKIDDAMRLS